MVSAGRADVCVHAMQPACALTAGTNRTCRGPTGKQLQELAGLSFNPTDLSVIMAVIESRLAYPPQLWRNVYKVNACCCWPLLSPPLRI